MRTSCLLVLVCFAIVCFAQTTPRDKALITSLPGLASLPPYDQYSGYINLQGTTKNIFYWFVTAQTNPEDAPVLLWLQGGPGCSGIGDGLLLEHGPFQPTILNAASKSVGLADRFYTWNTEANIIYIEQPAGVGFSYGTSPGDETSNDNTTAYDNYLFLEGFFQVYPEWYDNEFWVTGESYGGVYITTLAYEILTQSDETLISNLERGGLMLGNPVTNCDTPSYTGENGVLEKDTQVGMFYWHGMVSRRNFDTWNSNGCNTQNPPSVAFCDQLYLQIRSSVGVLDQPTQDLLSRLVEERRAATKQPDASINPDMLYYSYCTGNGTLDFNVVSVPECFDLDSQVSAYLNQRSVQTAIHAQPTIWSECGGVAYKKTVGSVIPYLESFFTMAPTMRILYYAGDVDIATVPFAQTQRCLETMDRTITQPWRPWVINGEVAGYVEVYDTYTFATLKGAGHEAPEFQGASGYALFSYFLNNVDLPQ